MAIGLWALFFPILTPSLPRTIIYLSFFLSFIFRYLIPTLHLPCLLAGLLVSSVHPFYLLSVWPSYRVLMMIGNVSDSWATLLRQ